MKQKKYEREKDINILLEIINNRNEYKENSENGLVILLNGSWGSGKTTFLKDLEHKIMKDERYELFTNYNSYEYDFYDNAYLPFFATINDRVNLGKDFGKLMKNTTKNVAYGMFIGAYSITNFIFKKKFDIDLGELKENILGIQDEDYLKSFNDFKECKESIKNKLEKYCQKKPQIIIVDELDRCKPSFAMETLEIIKHFFDIENCIFIIAIDKIQLQESAKTIYGQNMDSEKYFSKFFDYQYNLLPLNFYEIVDTKGIEELEKVVVSATKLFNCLRVSSRDSKKIFSEYVQKYRMFSDVNDNWSAEQSLFIIFLLTLKYVDLLFYTELMNGNFSRFKKKLLDELNQNSNDYSRLLSTNIGDYRSFEYACERISSLLDMEFMTKEELSTEIYPKNEAYKQRKMISMDLIKYIPSVDKNLTVKETIETIIN